MSGDRAFTEMIILKDFLKIFQMSHVSQGPISSHLRDTIVFRDRDMFFQKS